MSTNSSATFLSEIMHRLHDACLALAGTPALARTLALVQVGLVTLANLALARTFARFLVVVVGPVVALANTFALAIASVTANASLAVAINTCAFCLSHLRTLLEVKWQRDCNLVNVCYVIGGSGRKRECGRQN